MFELEVACREGSYVVRIGEDLFRSVLHEGADVVVADSYFAPQLADSPVPVVYVDVDEKNKTLAYAERLIVACFEAGARRGSHLLAVGGGVVQDLATLVASLYMRGVAWSYAPTTLMAMADSCVGGKSSINAGTAKNLVGNIYPPRGITIDPLFLTSLGDEEMVAGLSEAVKICFCRGLRSFDEYLGHFDRFSVDPQQIPGLIHHVLAAKKWFVEVDEFDVKERRQLNFGHTFAHAIESATSFAVNHGVAVALGMLCALKLSEQSDDLGEPGVRLAGHCHTLLSRVPGLSTRLAAMDEARFESAFRADKKHSADTFRVILPRPDGGVREAAMRTSDRNMAAVMESLRMAVAEVAA